MEHTRVQSPVSAPRSGGSGKGGKRRKPKKEGSFAKRFAVGFLKFVAVCVCLCIIVGSVAAVALSMYIVKVTENDATLLDLQNLELSYTTIIYYREETESGQEEWKEYARLTSAAEDRIWVDSSAISDNLKNAFIAIEDRDFYKHQGFNFKRTVYAFLNEVAYHLTGSYLRGNMQGASTIEQQLIKNITGDDETDYMRKVREIFRAVALDNRYSKEEILEAYLNTIGLTGSVAGVEAGANRYFDKHAGDNENIAEGKEPLTLAECASIAAITNAPTKYSPITNPEDHLTRRNLILYQMWQQEYITEEQYNEAVAEPLRLAETIVDPDAAQQSNNSWFTDTIIEEVIADLQEQKGMSRDEATNYLYSGGLRIYSTVVPSLQQKMEDTFAAKTYWRAGTMDYESGKVDAEGNPITEEIETQAAGVSINYKGELCAVVGGLGQKEGDRLSNRALIPRAVGSTMKGVAVYPLAIENNIATFSSTQLDAPIEQEVKDDAGNIIKGWPTNVDTWTNVPLTVYQAIKVSKNTIAVRWGQQVGLSEMYEFAHDTLEIDTLDENDAVSLASMCLGGNSYGISPYQLAGAYMMYGNGGMFYSLHAYVSIEDYKGEVVLEPEINRVQAISEDTAYIMNRLLHGVMESGGGTAYGASVSANGLDTIGKTGTTNDNKDIWFVGLTPYYVSAFWYGYDENVGMSWYRHSMHPGTKAFKAIMDDELSDEAKYPYIDWPEPPEGSVVPKTFCMDSGALAGTNCPNKKTGYYKADNLPSASCPIHYAG